MLQIIARWLIVSFCLIVATGCGNQRPSITAKREDPEPDALPKGEDRKPPIPPHVPVSPIKFGANYERELPESILPVKTVRYVFSEDSSVKVYQELDDTGWVIKVKEQPRLLETLHSRDESDGLKIFFGKDVHYDPPFDLNRKLFASDVAKIALTTPKNWYLVIEAPVEYQSQSVIIDLRNCNPDSLCSDSGYDNRTQVLNVGPDGNTLTGTGEKGAFELHIQK